MSRTLPLASLQASRGEFGLQYEWSVRYDKPAASLDYGVINIIFNLYANERFQAVISLTILSQPQIDSNSSRVGG